MVELEGDFTHRMLHCRGIRLHAVTAGNPGHPLIVLLHGAFGGWFDFAETIAPLAARGFHVAALDMRGYGMSDKPRPRTGNGMLLAVGDVKGIITTLGHSQAILAGADTGGAVAWTAAATQPDVVRGLVSVSAAHPADLQAFALRRPWAVAPTIARAVLFRLPPGLLAGLRRRIHGISLTLNTAAGFRGGHRFGEVLALRRAAAEIDNAFPHAVHNSRLLTQTAGPRGAAVNAPTLLIHPPQGPWARIAPRQRSRVDAHVSEACVSGAKNLPHLENPAGFVDAVAGFARGL